MKDMNVNNSYFLNTDGVISYPIFNNGSVNIDEL